MLQVLSNILSEIKKLNKLMQSQNRNQCLWRTDDIANYMNLTTSSVQSTILKAPGFPIPIILPSGGKRWVPEEVRLWAKRHKKLKE